MLTVSINSNIISSHINMQKYPSDDCLKKYSDKQLLTVIGSKEIDLEVRKDFLAELAERAAGKKPELYGEIYAIVSRGNTFAHSNCNDDNSKFLIECIDVLANEKNIDREHQLSELRNKFGKISRDFSEDPRRYASLKLVEINVKKQSAEDLILSGDKLKGISKSLDLESGYQMFSIITSDGDGLRRLSDDDLGILKEALFLTGRIQNKEVSREAVKKAIAILQFDHKIEGGSSGNKIGHGTIEKLLSEIKRF